MGAGAVAALTYRAEFGYPALLTAASALLPTRASDAAPRLRTGVETSLDTAGTSACARPSGEV